VDKGRSDRRQRGAKQLQTQFDQSCRSPREKAAGDYRLVTSVIAFIFCARETTY
jgi:hypothetical protein